MRSLAVVVVLLVASCTKPNPVVCCTSPSDCNSLGVMDTSRPCTDGFVCIDHECSSAPPVDAGPACTMDTDCPSNSPHCSSTNECVGCVDSTQCSQNMPVCDSSAMTCRGCADDSECSSKACDMNTGLCISESTVLYASPDGADGAACSQADPCSITHAISSVDSTRATVKLTAGTYTPPLSVGSKTMVIHGLGATLTRAQSGYALTIGVGAHVRVIGLTITSTGPGIECGPVDANATPVPFLELDNVTVSADANFALFAYPCNFVASGSHFSSGMFSPALFIATPSTATIDRSIFDGGGIEAAGLGSVVHVTNSLFYNQDVGPGSPGPLSGKAFGNAGPGEAFASFSTFANANLSCGNVLPACAGGSGDGVCIDSSIVTSASGDAIQGTGCSVSYSIAMPQVAALNGTNNQVNVDPLFVGGGSYALKGSSPAVDAADPNAVDTIDLAGTPRPQGPRNDIGAYEYKP